VPIFVVTTTQTTTYDQIIEADDLAAAKAHCQTLGQANTMGPARGSTDVPAVRPASAREIEQHRNQIITVPK
jgi:hypothetical protein